MYAKLTLVKMNTIAQAHVTRVMKFPAVHRQHPVWCRNTIDEDFDGARSFNDSGGGGFTTARPERRRRTWRDCDQP